MWLFSKASSQSALLPCQKLGRPLVSSGHRSTGWRPFYWRYSHVVEAGEDDDEDGEWEGVLA